jgi:hypothetical protein
VPRAFAGLIWETPKVRDRRPDDIKGDLKLERLRSSVEVGQEKCTYDRVLQGCAVSVHTPVIKVGLVLSMATHRLIKGQNILGFPSRVDFAMLNFLHGLYISLELRGKRCV